MQGCCCCTSNRTELHCSAVVSVAAMQYALDRRSSWLGCPASHFRNSPSLRKCGLPERIVYTVMATSTGTLEPSIADERGRLQGLRGSKRVVLVRHGQSTWNESGRIQGSSDFSQLTAKGETQAETSRQMLLADSFDVCFHSPLARAKKTAEIIWGSREREMLPLHDLREIDLYSFQGLFKEQGKELFGEAYRMWQKEPVNFVIDGHYPVRELWERAESCWNSILSSKGNSVLVVAHNAVNQALIATATGLGSEYFRQLLQSNCGVSVLDFNPRRGLDGPPHVCLNRLNQTPGPPVLGGEASGRKSRIRILLVCHGATDSSFKKRFPLSESEPANMLGIIQSGKTAELLLDVSVDSLLSSPHTCALTTAAAIAQVQEAADCLGGDCIPRYVDVTEWPELRDLNWGSWKGMPKEEVAADRWQDYLQHNSVADGETWDEFWQRGRKSWQTLLKHLDSLQTENGDKTVVVVGHSVLHASMLCNCLGLDQSYLASFHLDTSSISVIDFPDGAFGKGIVRCVNYTAHLGRWAVPVTRPTPSEEEF